ncbi:hypothetical protein ASG32_31200 [Methylobacterium sp. Leaf361]|uniref:hypothetical protein n=1 Tax=Methylobacterium sp. Leaf361 TaxID=1736352 RepID=UPI0006F6D5A8|nr:hypothetical protein [Methylobacterium sp. Leaf361]KQS64027.1 hypothetical protein ASG32_31200 [Methylobacterium sp. Leaf361]
MSAFTRRSALAAALALASYRATAAAADPFPAAIRRAQAADAAYREAGRFAREIQAAGLPLPADWRAYRIGLAMARADARDELHALTPTAPEAAAALVAYYRRRAEASGDPCAFRAARSRLRKVAQRPGAVALDVTQLARASPG